MILQDRRNSGSHLKQVKNQDYYSPIAIDFGNSCIKMIQLHRINEKSALWQKAICPTPVGSITEGGRVEPELLIRQLQKMRREICWKGKQVNCSLPSQAAHTKIVTLPTMNARQVDRAMHLQAEMLFSVEMNAVEISYCSLNLGDQYYCNDQQRNLTRQYLLTVVTTEILKIYKSIVEEVGFSLQSFEAPVGSLMRSISQIGIMPSLVDENASERIIIDFGGKSTKVLIVKRDGSVKIQNIAIGCDNFQQVISNKWPALKDKAEQALFSTGSLSNKGLLPLTHQLTYAIKKIVTYRASPVKSSTNAAYPAIAICGGGIYIPGLIGHLQNELGMRLSIYNPLQHHLTEIDKNSRLQNNNISLFATAHGLAIQH